MPPPNIPASNPGHAHGPGQGPGVTSATAARAPGSFSTAFNSRTPAGSSGQRPQIHRIDTSTSSSSEDQPAPTYPRTRQPQSAQALRSAALTSPTYHANTSSTSLQNFSRPHVSLAPRAENQSVRTVSPLTLGTRPSVGDFGASLRSHARKHSHSQGFFEPSLPQSSFLSPTLDAKGMGVPNSNLTASQIAAQAAMQHQNLQARQRSQTLPLDNNANGGQRKSSRGLASPPLLSLTEASGERQSGFDAAAKHGGQVYHNGLLGGGTSAATSAANAAFPRSPQMSPSHTMSEFPLPTYREPEKPAKPEKSSKVKLFSRPGKISTKDTKEKSIPSPSKLAAHTLGTLQRSNMSMNSLADSTLTSPSSMYSMANSSTATIRAVDQPVQSDKEKEKKHNFLSRQKHKLSNKEDHHLPLSSAASNSRPVDPSAPSSLYNFSLPPSPGPSTTSFAKSMSGLDLRHGGRALREKKHHDKALAASESHQSDIGAHQGGSEWPGPSSLGSTTSGYPWAPSGSHSVLSLALHGSDTHQDLAKYGLNNMTPDDAWPFLKAKLLIIFEGEDLRLPVEDFNRLVTTHIQRCIQKHAPKALLDDLRDLLVTGFKSLDQTLRRTPDDRLVTHLVEMWIFTFTQILPYMQAVFLPLDLEFSGHGPIMSADMARDFWAGLPTTSASQQGVIPSVLTSRILDVRRIVLLTYRDIVILPRFETLKTIFSRLSLETLNTNMHNTHLLDNLSSSPSSSGGARPGTAMSLDPAHSSYSSQNTTLLGGTDSSSGARSRAISNVSYGSDHGPRTIDPTMMPPPPMRPFTPSSSHPSFSGSSSAGGAQLAPSAREAAALQREVNAAESKNVTETVGRMLQCMSVLVSVGVVAGFRVAVADGDDAKAVAGDGDDGAQKKMEELCKTLKLNWLGRGRTGRNRRGFVGTKVRREGEGSML